MSAQPETRGEVSIRLGEDELVTISPPTPRPAPVDTASIPAAGGVLFVDVTRPEQAPHAILHDSFVAQAWLAGVYGTVVAEAVEALVDEAEHAEPVRVAVARGALTDAVERLAVGFWLHRWWPSGAPAIPDIDERILEIEIAANAWVAEAVFVATDAIEALLAPHTEFLTSQVQALRSMAGKGAELDLGVLESALRATVDLVEDTVLGYHECATLLATIESENSAVDDAMGAVQWDSLVADLWDQFVEGLAATRTELTLASRGQSGTAISDVLRRGVTTVDELQVGPRTVAARAGNVTWQLIADGSGGATLTIRVAAAPQHPQDSDTPLLARVYLSAVPEVFSLWYDAGWRAFVGTHRWPTIPDSDPRIDIFDPAYAVRPRLSEQGRTEAAADRARREEIIVSRRDAANSRVFIAERAAWDDADE
ncbi:MULTISPECIES: hypothetical protein [Aeromicrobium]|uniref:hypothetical protein n=1 Tax=Aeromicrobium TaxID=2040 RepID=UPI002580ED3A|nr:MULTISPECIES: hypothetical protein [Aeromicrobium]